MPEVLFGYMSNFEVAGDTKATLFAPDMLLTMHTLDLQGLKFDNVEFRIPGVFDCDNNLELWIKDLPLGLDMVWREISERESYPNGHDLLDTYIRTMAGGGDKKAGYNTPPSSSTGGLEADFAAYWDHGDQDMECLDPSYRDKFLPLIKNGDAKVFRLDAGR